MSIDSANNESRENVTSAEVSSFYTGTLKDLYNGYGVHGGLNGKVGAKAIDLTSTYFFHSYPENEERGCNFAYIDKKGQINVRTRSYQGLASLNPKIQVPKALEKQLRLLIEEMVRIRALEVSNKDRDLETRVSNQESSSAEIRQMIPNLKPARYNRSPDEDSNVICLPTSHKKEAITPYQSSDIEYDDMLTKITSTLPSQTQIPNEFIIKSTNNMPTKKREIIKLDKYRGKYKSTDREYKSSEIIKLEIHKNNN